MIPTICRQCGGPIFYDARQHENPNICHVCAEGSLEPDFVGENVVCLPPWFEADQTNGVSIARYSPETEEAVAGPSMTTASRGPLKRRATCTVRGAKGTTRTSRLRGRPSNV